MPTENRCRRRGQKLQHEVGVSGQGPLDDVRLRRLNRSPQRHRTLEPSCQDNPRIQHPRRPVVRSTRYRNPCSTSDSRTRRRRSPLASACRFFCSLPPYAAHCRRQRVLVVFLSSLSLAFCILFVFRTIGKIHPWTLAVVIVLSFGCVERILIIL